MVISRDLIGIYSDEMGDFMAVFNQQIMVPFSGRYTVILAGYPYFQTYIPVIQHIYGNWPMDRFFTIAIR